MGTPEPKVSAIVVARDEEETIASCLRSIYWADERIVVVDAETRDKTAEVARPLATEVIVREWEGFAGSKRFAVSLARHPWILWIDADEEVDPVLAESIRRAVRSPGGAAGFRVRRRNRYLGRIIRHGAWTDDRVVRLFLAEKGRLADRLVHESVVLDGPVGDLEGFLEHRSYRDLAHHWEKIGLMSRLWAEEAMRGGKRAGALDLIARPPIRFVKGFLFKAGFLDGRVGLVLAFMDAVYVGTKYARLLEIQGENR